MAMPAPLEAAGGVARSMSARRAAVQCAQAELLPALRIEIVGREPMLERPLACRPLAVEHRIIGGVAIAAFGDHVLAQHALEHEAIAQRCPPRWRVERVAFP